MKRVKKGIYKKVPPPQMPVMDMPGVCRYLGLGKSLVYVLVRKNKIPYLRAGRTYLFHRDAIRAWLDACRIDVEREVDLMRCGKCSTAFKEKFAIKGKTPGTAVCPRCGNEVGLSTVSPQSDKGTVVETPMTTTLPSTQTGTESPRGSTLKEHP
jgi:excisionase family DNA binding protein